MAFQLNLIMFLKLLYHPAFFNFCYDGDDDDDDDHHTPREDWKAHWAQGVKRFALFSGVEFRVVIAIIIKKTSFRLSTLPMLWDRTFLLGPVRTQHDTKKKTLESLFRQLDSSFVLF